MELLLAVVVTLLDRNIVGYEVIVECEEPDLHESLGSRHVEAKVAALLAHESQFETTMSISADDDGSDRAGFSARIVGEARDAGRSAGLALAEPFRLLDPAG